MAMLSMDAKGMKCLMPSIKLTQMLLKREIKRGDVLEGVGDCPKLESDMRTWCQATKKVLISITPQQNGVKRCQLQI